MNLHSLDNKIIHNKQLSNSPPYILIMSINVCNLTGRLMDKRFDNLCKFLVSIHITRNIEYTMKTK